MTDDLQHATIRLTVTDPAEIAAPDGGPVAVLWPFDDGHPDKVKPYEIAAADRRLLDWYRLAPDDLIQLHRNRRYRADSIMGDYACYCWNRIEYLLTPAS